MENGNYAVSSESLEIYVSKLLEEKNFKDLDEEVIEQLKDDLMERVEDRINAVIISNLPEEKLDEFENMLDAESAETIRAYCEGLIPGLAELIAEELVKFRKTYLNI